MLMRKIIVGIILVLVFVSCFAEAKVRNVKAIGEEALRKGIISAPPAEHDFTKIPEGASYKEGQLLVRFEPRRVRGKLSAMSKNEKKGILNSLGGAVEKRKYDLVPGLSLIELPEGMTVEEGLKRFNNKSGIMYAEPDYRAKACATPNDPMFSSLWGLHNTGQTGGVEDADIDAPEAWDIVTDANIIVAVVDTGIDYTHPDLQANMWKNPVEVSGDKNSDGRPGIANVDDDGDGLIDEDSEGREPNDPNYTNDLVNDDDENGYEDDIRGWDFCNDDSSPKDDCFHGTHVAGTIGAVGDNNLGVVGVCWNVKIMSLKFLDEYGYGDVSDAIDCVNYSILMGANLSNHSWGVSSYSQSLKNAINASGAAGMLCVAAAGNDGDDTDIFSHYPSSYNCNNIISVLSTNKNDNKATSSNYGLTSVDIGAPGVEILSTFPTYTTTLMMLEYFDEDYETISGTSMATPHVSGTCALMWAAHPELSNLEVKETIFLAAEKLPALSGKCVTGSRLNLHRAVTRSYSEAILELDEDYYSCDDEIEISLIDSDLIDAGSQIVYLDTYPGGDVEEVNLTEIWLGIFTGTIYTDGNTPSPNDGTLQLSHGDIITVTYYDANDGNGNPVEVNDVAEADCEGPVISNIAYDSIVIVPGSQTITFETDEEATVKVRCGEDCNDYSMQKSGSLSTEHSIEFNGCSPRTDYYFEIEATDKLGNVTVDNNDGNCYDFLAYPKNTYVPEDFNTIQEAIDDVLDGYGCIIWVDEGIWGDIDFLGKALTVSSTKPDDWDVVAATVIDANGETAAVLLDSSEDSNSVLKGFTIRNSSSIGVRISASSPIISNCIIEDNSNGISCFTGSSPTITNNIIRENNIAINSTLSSSPAIQNNWIYRNNGGVLTIISGGTVIRNNTIAYNSNYGIQASGAAPTISNCILWGNSNELNSCSATYSCIEDCNDATGTGNICGEANDPNFADADSNDFHINLDSPCIDSGDPNGDYDDQLDIDNNPRLLDTVVDIGADETGRVYNLNNLRSYDSISPAVNEASDYDVIVASPWHYYESVDVESKQITLRSTDPNDPCIVATTIIDADGDDYVLDSSNDGFVLNGFTIRGGDCGGIYSYCGCLNISNCIIEDNTGEGICQCYCGTPPSSCLAVKNCTIRNNYSGIYTDYSTVVIEDCKIYGHNADNGIEISSGANATISNNLIYDNKVGVYVNSGTDPIISRNIFYDNNRGIHADEDSDPTIINNLIYSNTIGVFADYDFVGTIINNTIVNSTSIGILSPVGENPTIYNCILWGNGYSDLQNCNATYSCIEDCNEVNESNYNICVDPCFVSPDSNDFNLNIHSPCVNAGNPSGDYSDQNDIGGGPRVIGSYVDMGADEVNVPVADEHQWGLDEKSGTTAYDSVDSDDGTFNGDDPCWVDGLIGGAVDFNGVNDYFSVSSLDDEYSSSSVFTVAGWFNTNQSSGTQTIVGQWSQMWEAGQEYLGWQVLVENSKVVARFGYGVPTYDITGTTDVNEGEWYHFAMVRNGTSTFLYVDGQPEDSDTVSFSVYSTKFRIGDGSYVISGSPALKGGPFNGKIDDVMIFDGALSAGEIEDLFDAGAPD